MALNKEALEEQLTRITEEFSVIDQKRQELLSELNRITSEGIRLQGAHRLLKELIGGEGNA